ncbi:unnamed protein product [Diabrotica balteata]|uniref:Uncharacterized protein n=1 Tax=Diabrotica balteata TaxID=107213 RepID=A0A9N9SRK4_DIABA|nr:unnamed protein product [Diabrotica balteata]
MSLASKLNRIREESPNTMYENLNTCIQAAANEPLGVKVFSVKYKNKTTWWNKDLGKIVDEKKAAYGKLLSTQNV